MPLSGMEPASVNIAPNTSPIINAFTPDLLNQILVIGNSIDFSINTSDAENDFLSYSWILDGLNVGSTNSFTYNPGEPDLGLHSLLAIVSDNVPGNMPDTVEWDIEVIDEALTLNLKVFLEGPYQQTTMSVNLNSLDFVPLNQPYNNTPWNYLGTEEVIAIPGIDVVDWIIVELRDATNAANANASTTIDQQAAFVKTDGTVIGIDGNSNLIFASSISNDLFVVIRHRNHIDVLSANPLFATEGIYTYDFTDAETKVYGGASAHKEIVPGIWGLTSADGYSDGMVNNQDYSNGWSIETGNSGYLGNDYNLDGQSNNQDKDDFWLPNNGSGSSIPD